MNLVSLLVVLFCLTAASSQRPWPSQRTQPLEEFPNPHWHSFHGGHESHDGPEGRPPHHFSPPPPPFLKNVSEEGRKEFLKIVMNESLTKAEVQSQLEEWAANQGGEIKDAFEKETQKMEQTMQLMKTEAEELIENVTELREAIEAVKNNMQITGREEMDQILRLLRKTSAPVAIVMKAVGEALMRREFHHSDQNGFSGSSDGFTGSLGKDTRGRFKRSQGLLSGISRQASFPSGSGGFPEGPGGLHGGQGGFPGNGGQGSFPGNGYQQGFPGGPGGFPGNGGQGGFPGNGGQGSFPGNGYQQGFPGGPGGFPGNGGPGGFPGNGGQGGFPGNGGQGAFPGGPGGFPGNGGQGGFPSNGGQGGFPGNGGQGSYLGNGRPGRPGHHREHGY